MTTNLNDLTHMPASREGLTQFQHGSTLCGKGLWNGGKGSLNLVPTFMGQALSLPSCRQCREKVIEMNLLRNPQNA